MATFTFPVFFQCFDIMEKQLGCPDFIPMAMLEPHRVTVQKIHGQTIEQLAQRGGLSPHGLMTIIKDDTSWWRKDIATVVSVLKAEVEKFEATS